VNGTLSGSGDIELDQVQVIGSGTLTKSLTFDNNDSVTPGNNIGAMSFTGDQVWGGNASYFWEINDTSGAAGDAIGWDLVNISGTLDITATSINPFTVNVASLDIFTSSTGDVYNLNNFQSYSWVIASAGSITNFSVDKFVVNTAGLSNTVNGTFAIAQQGNNLVLTYTAVDIPSLTYDTFTFNLPFNERGELDDPDGDGVENIIEFALGRDGGSIVGEGAVAEANIDETIPDSREFSISFRLPDPVREQLVYEVSVSETLAPDSWALIAIKNGVAPWQGPATVVTTAPIGGFVTVTVQDIVPVGPNGKRFLKFDVSASQDGPQ